MSSDVLVIGGGVIGLSTAIELAHHGAQVSVVCRDTEESATRNAAGMMAAQCERLEGGLLQLATQSLSLYPSYINSLPTDVRYTARDDFLIPVLDDEVGDINYGRQAIDALEPSLGPRVRGARTAVGDAHIDNRALLVALQAACRQHGVQFRRDTVTRLQISGHQISHAVLQNGDLLTAASYVAAAGAWTKQLLPLIPIRPVKGQMLSLRPRSATSPLPIHVLHGRDAYVVPKPSGLYYVGATVEDVGFDRIPTAGAVMKLLQAATTLVPAFADCAIEEIWAGLRPTTPDLLPIIGATPYNNLCVATGTFRNGVLFAPAIAKMAAACLDVGNRLSPELSSLLDSFALSRFTESSPTPANVLPTGDADESKPFSPPSVETKRVPVLPTPPKNNPVESSSSPAANKQRILVERVLEDGTREPIEPSKQFLERQRMNIAQTNESRSEGVVQPVDEHSESSTTGDEELLARTENPISNGTAKPLRSDERPQEAFGMMGDAYDDVLKFRENAEEKLKKALAENRAFGRTKSTLEKEGDAPLMMSREDEIAFDAAYAAGEADVAAMGPDEFPAEPTAPSNAVPNSTAESNGGLPSTSTTTDRATTNGPGTSNAPILIEHVLEDGTREPIEPSAQYLKRKQQEQEAAADNGNPSNGAKPLRSDERPQEAFGMMGDAYDDVLKFRENAEEKLKKGLAENRAFGRTKSTLEKEGDAPLMMWREDEIVFDAAFAAADEAIAAMDPDPDTFDIDFDRWR